MSYIDHQDGPLSSDLKMAQAPIPIPRPEEVRIRVHYAGINRADLLQRQGLYPAPAGAHTPLGLEVAGVIDATGENVTHWRTGQAVCALTPGGGYAEYVTVLATHCLSIPSGCSLAQAAALPEACFTTYFTLFERDHLLANESIVIHGGTSGVGSMAIQLSLAQGLRVYTTVGSSQKVAVCEQWGCVKAVCHRTEDFVAVIRAHSPLGGVDVIFDIVGGAYFERNLRLLRPFGRLICVGFLGGAHVTTSLTSIVTKHLSIRGSAMRTQPDETKNRLAVAIEKVVWPWIEQKIVSPHIDTIFPWQEVKKAHDYMETCQHIGKILLHVASVPYEH